MQQYGNHSKMILCISKYHAAPSFLGWYASAPILIFTSSPNLGRSVFIPKSERLISVVAVNHAVILSVMGFTSNLLRVTDNVTGFDTPCSVKTPCTFAVFSPVTSTLSLTKVAVGYFSVSKNSFPFRCLSSSAWQVAKSATLITALTLLLAGLSLSNTNAPLAYHLPACVEKPKCLICQST